MPYAKRGYKKRKVKLHRPKGKYVGVERVRAETTDKEEIHELTKKPTKLKGMTSGGNPRRKKKRRGQARHWGVTNGISPSTGVGGS